MTLTASNWPCYDSGRFHAESGRIPLEVGRWAIGETYNTFE